MKKNFLFLLLSIVGSVQAQIGIDKILQIQALY
jgi:hypothetical protein